MALDTDAKIDNKHYPIAIIQDRYTGVYSRGLWLAISDATRQHEGQTRCNFVLSDEDFTVGPHGDDTSARNFWANPPDWIAIGDSPDEAVKNLLAGVRPRSRP